jgi:DMSO reductase anchor subunit
MHPAFSVIFLTTLIGVGQGLFLALYTGESYATVKLLPEQSSAFYSWGSFIALMFLVAGLIASFFHLGHPERAWRAAAKWRTSWLSREVIVLPIMMGALAVYGIVHYFGWDLTLIGIETQVKGDLTLLIGAAGVVVAFALYLCTGMIYACIKFIQEWATPLTVVNYALIGIASGFTLATAFAAWQAPLLVNFYGGWAIIITVAALFMRGFALFRNARIRRKSNLQTAIGVRDRRIEQKAMGFMGGSFNTREFFHHASEFMFRSVKWLFLVAAFIVPVALLAYALLVTSTTLLWIAFVVQYLGIMAERWFFFAQANHPQNLYYQKVG